MAGKRAVKQSPRTTSKQHFDLRNMILYQKIKAGKFYFQFELVLV